MCSMQDTGSVLGCRVGAVVAVGAVVVVVVVVVVVEPAVEDLPLPQLTALPSCPVCEC